MILYKIYNVSFYSDSASPYYTFTNAEGNTGVPTLTSGKTYKFIYNSSVHPFHIGSSYLVNNLFPIQSSGTDTAIGGTYSYNSLTNGEYLIFTIPDDFTGTIQYFCSAHSSMLGTFG